MIQHSTRTRVFCPPADAGGTDLVFAAVQRSKPVRRLFLVHNGYVDVSKTYKFFDEPHSAVTAAHFRSRRSTAVLLRVRSRSFSYLGAGTSVAKASPDKSNNGSGSETAVARRFGGGALHLKRWRLIRGNGVAYNSRRAIRQGC